MQTHTPDPTSNKKSRLRLCCPTVPGRLLLRSYVACWGNDDSCTPKLCNTCSLRKHTLPEYKEKKTYLQYYFFFFLTHPDDRPHIDPENQWHQTLLLLFHWRMNALLSLWGWHYGAVSSVGHWWPGQLIILLGCSCLLRGQDHRQYVISIKVRATLVNLAKKELNKYLCHEVYNTPL